MRVYYGKYRDTSNLTSEEFLHINSCGTTYLRGYARNEAFRVCRPEGRVDYYIVIIGKCSAEATVNGKNYQLKENDCLVYYPHDAQDYSLKIDSDKAQVCAYWVHFCGTASEELMSKAGFTGSCVLRSVAGDFTRYFDALVRADRNCDELSSVAHLMTLISLISPKSNRKENSSISLVRNEATYIGRHFTEEIDFEKCAERCNLSRSRFTHVFSGLYGVAPHKYMLLLRIEQAKELLCHSMLSISEVAEQCGFKDSLYFSRLFSQNIGYSPTQYRNNNAER